MEKYPSGRRGSPAKGVVWLKPQRGFKSLLLRHNYSLKKMSCGENRRTSGFFGGFYPKKAVKMKLNFEDVISVIFSSLGI